MQSNDFHIFNFRQLTDTIAIGGRPDQAAIYKLADAGFQAVIQVNVEESPSNAVDEAYHARINKMKYSGMHMSFSHPTVEDVATFFALLEKHAKQSVFVHCAAGYCTSSMMVMYHMLCDGIDAETAVAKYAIENWTLQPQWQALFDTVVQFTSIEDFINQVEDTQIGS